MEHATAQTIERLLAERKVVVVDFYATWCGPCKSYSPKFQRLERELRRAVPEASVAFVAVDIDADHELARSARVMSVPTTVAWTMGKTLFGRRKRTEILRFSGDRPWPDLVRTFTALLAKHAA